MLKMEHVEVVLEEQCGCRWSWGQLQEWMQEHVCAKVVSGQCVWGFQEAVGSLRRRFLKHSPKQVQDGASVAVSGERSDKVVEEHEEFLDKGTTEYEFTREEEQVFRKVVSSLQIGTLAKLVQAAGEMVLMAANVAVRNRAFALSSLFDLLEELSVAGFMSRSCSSFNRIINTSGQDMQNLMVGLGSKSGLAKLFNQLAQASRLLAVAQVLQGISALSTHVPWSVFRSVATSVQTLWAGGAAGLILTLLAIWMQDASD
eukprot:jgi/Botrbrau1/8112/Bobra.0308s0007.1